ncbi:MAG TPA: FKBP-type peptidyl-prolyl cis-trans isomerase [Pyrinomonadaceae bacterium]|nr:FKBP-type peptidyl-prolyl cis-trans isomerase [Pyrinomonadaceae bacterium]
MKLLVIAAIILLLPGSVPVAQGQTSRGRTGTARGRRTRAAGAERRTTAAATPNVVTTPSGLIYVITRRSDGRQPRIGEMVAVHYTGLLTNGVKFDSSLDSGEPIKFKLGAGRVIKGWDEGIGKLRVGEQATLIIPPQLGYGSRGAGGGAIPPDATLIFIVELVSVEETPAPN